MNFTHSKPNLVDPTIIKKVMLFREKTNNKYFNISDNVKTWGLIILFIGIFGYILYYRYYNRTDTKETNETKEEFAPIVQQEPTSYHQVQTHHVSLVKQVPIPPVNQEMQPPVEQGRLNNPIPTRMQEDYQYITQASGTPNLPRKIPVDLGADPKPININPTEKYQENKCGMRQAHPYDYSLQAKSFSNLNQTLIGGNFAPA